MHSPVAGPLLHFAPSGAPDAQMIDTRTSPSLHETSAPVTSRNPLTPADP
jgi:hypothetical protein